MANLPLYLLGVGLAVISGIVNNIGTVMQKKVVNQFREEQNFMKKVDQFKEQFVGGHPVTFRVLSFLRKWFTNHILDVDREYVDIVRSGNK